MAPRPEWHTCQATPGSTWQITPPVTAPSAPGHLGPDPGTTLALQYKTKSEAGFPGGSGGIYLPMQETWVRPLIQKDFTRHGAANLCATTVEPVL